MSLCDNKQFQAGNVHTDFIKENKDALFHIQEVTPTIAVAAASAYLNAQQQFAFVTSAYFSFENLRSIDFNF
jgi:hypothetical protein